jgi:hypothetical protein
MGEKRSRQMWPLGQIKARGKSVPGMAGEGETFGRHWQSPSSEPEDGRRTPARQPA